jgi:hypothetical protein
MVEFEDCGSLPQSGRFRPKWASVSRQETRQNKGLQFSTVPIEAERSRRRGGKLKMRRVIAVAIAGVSLGTSLGGCSSFSFDYFKSTPPSIQVQLESTPPGADAKTSIGPGCKTPCSVSIAAPDSGFSVAYALDKFEPQTVQVKVIRNPGDATGPATTVTDPNPVFAELQPAAPPPKARKPLRPKKPKAPKPAAAAPADSGFPDPNAAPEAAAPAH